MVLDQTRATPVAVIGMGCRLPGGIDSPEQLWEALLRGDDLITEVPADRWDVDEFYDPEPGVPGRTVCKWGAFLDDAADFDPEFFGITEKEATAMDPQHRLLLATSWEAMEQGGFSRETLASARTGVFVGLMHDDYQFVHADAQTLSGPYGYMGNSFAMGSGRVAYTMGLKGPAITVDTACSSGLAAIHLACRSLHEGESDLAFAGGASVMFEPRKAASGSAIGMLSPTGRCHSFDVEADGFVVGEGCVVLLLKRLPDALADGDRILAVVRGTAVNQDGHTVNIVTPSHPAQVEAYRTALAAADVDPGSVGMVEAHGPGTPVGDPIEYASLAEVYGVDGPCALGSLKSNFGHTQAAAGALGLMKAVLAVQHGVVPRSLHFNQLPDDFAKITTNLFVPQSTTPWPSNNHQAPRRAAVSSYGFSGTNVHAIVEQAPEAVAAQSELDAPSPAIDGPLMFPLSATSADGLRQTARRIADWVDANAADLSATDLAYTLNRRREHRPVRTAVFADTLEKLSERLREVADGDFPYQAAVGKDDQGPVWIFSGQGSQWAAMGAELLATEPVFAATVAEAEPLIAEESGFSVTEAISAPETLTGIERVQPALFTMQVALAATMRSYGVLPGAVIGHSMGEAAAAVVAGALSLQDGVRVICRRSRLMSTISGSGAMASVELPAQQVLTELMARGVNGEVVVAVVASPQSTVIGGVTETVRELVAAWEQREVMAREVAVEVASHSPQVDSILDDLADELADLKPMTPDVPFYSSTMFDPREQLECDGWYWADNLRHTVRFAAAVQAALEDGYRVFAELAPHPLLTHAAEQTAESLGVPLAALSAMRREQELPDGLRGFLGDLYSAGAAIDFSLCHPQGRLVDVPLPAWTNRRLFLERGVQNSATGGGRTVAVHPLMGAHVQVQEQPERHVWQGEVGTGAQAWLGDYQIHDAAALPAAVYCEMALAASRAVLGEASELCDVRIEQSLMLDEENPIGAVASLESPGVLSFAVETIKDGRHARWATAVLRAVEDTDQPPAVDVAELLSTHPRRVEGAQVRDWFDRRGVQFGPAFTGLTCVHTSEGTDDTVLAEVALPLLLRSQQSGYRAHPALLAACFQSVEAHPSVEQIANGGVLSPLGVRQLRDYGSTRHARYCLTRVTSADTAGVAADLDILDEHGTVLMTLRGLEMGISQTSERDRVLGERLLSITWQQRELPETGAVDPGSWLLIAGSSSADGLANKLTDALKLGGAQCTSMSWPQSADAASKASWLREYLSSNVIDGVVVLSGSDHGEPDRECAVRGREHVRHLVRIARELPDIPAEPSRLFVVTGGAQTVLAGDSVNLEQAGLRGLMRVIGNEHPELRPTQIDLDEDTDVDCLARQLLLHSDEDETAWRGGAWYTARLSPAPLRPEDRQTAIVDLAQDGVRVQIRAPGDVESIEATAFDRVPPGAGEIEVAVSASSINYGDALVAFGRYPSIDGVAPQLGMDFAGVVTAVGPDVTTHHVGDRVGGFGKAGSWANFVTCDARVAVALPPGLTDELAAAVPTAHVTAWYGLHEQARIGADDRVLIHSATGGVGQAAIAIARAAGAEIFATAGSEDRRQLLRDMGITHVYDSRSTEFAEQIRRDTDGYGVDIVLNSLTGAAQRAGLELLSVGGRFVEIGKAEVYGNTRLELSPFRRNLTFHYVDLALMADSRPRRIGDLLGTVYRLIAEGELAPPQITHYPLLDASTAIRVISAAEHTGKLVLDVPHAGRSNIVVPPERTQVFRHDGSYIITGGLGGLGLFLAEKMVAAGCGRIVLTSRSEPTPKALDTIGLIQAMGGDIAVECGDITAPGTAEKLVAAATATGLPLRGVLHAAAVVEDATLENITDELIDRDWAAKANGAWNLHLALQEKEADQPLDWFCSFSSAAALVGSPGQGAYAAANSWLDAFSQWRRTQGLPATSIAWGIWGSIGRAAAVAEAADIAITPNEGAYAFQALLRHDRAYTGYAPMTGMPWVTALAQRSKFAELFRDSGKKSTASSKFLTNLRALPKEEWTPKLRRVVADKLSKILRRSVDPDRPLSEYGLDSLANLELRNYFKEETGIRITPSDISTANGLAEALYEYLTAEGDGGTAEPVKPVQIRRKKTPADPSLASATND